MCHFIGPHPEIRYLHILAGSLIPHPKATTFDVDHLDVVIGAGSIELVRFEGRVLCKSADGDE